MSQSFRKIFLAFLLITLCGCVTTNAAWYKSYSDNQLKIENGTIKGRGRFIRIENTNRVWEGEYKGGKAMIPLRKNLLVSAGKEEAKKVCGGMDFVILSGPEYVMQDTHPNSYGGGLLGYFIAHVLSKDENLPITMSFEFRCAVEEINE